MFPIRLLDINLIVKRNLRKEGSKMEKLYYINCPNCGKILCKSRTFGKNTIFTKCHGCNKWIEVQQEDDRIIINEMEKDTKLVK